ncbi:DDE-type integrase/transposase/recombinase [Deinococcus hopiensis]|uniref:Putative transposase n=1 Tax=Deinococcus hopiensis KR-140 TaxID=695939 RepID=A0A1W1UAH5_9DEIO|nr:putative transposase [Deinococcus hopiensis KR-140]
MTARPTTTVFPSASSVTLYGWITPSHSASVTCSNCFANAASSSVTRRKRQWNIKFSPLLTEELRHREPRRGSRWHLKEVCVQVGGVKHGLWGESTNAGTYWTSFSRNTAIPRRPSPYCVRLLSEYGVPEVIHTDKLWSRGAALPELPVLHTVEHVQVVSTARCNNLLEQSHRPTRRQERSEFGFKRRRRTQDCAARPSLEPSPPCPNDHPRCPQTKQPNRSTAPLARGNVAGGLILKPPAELLQPRSG